MKTFAIYTRDMGGMLTYQGEEAWDSLDDLLAYYARDDLEPETEALAGWPHASVTWYGTLGVAWART